MPKTTPMTDPRPFADVLRDWLSRMRLTMDAGAYLLGVTTRSLYRWRDGQETAHHRAYRALMTLIEEGRA